MRRGLGATQRRVLHDLEAQGGESQVWLLAMNAAGIDTEDREAPSKPPSATYNSVLRAVAALERRGLVETGWCYPGHKRVWLPGNGLKKLPGETKFPRRYRWGDLSEDILRISQSYTQEDIEKELLDGYGLRGYRRSNFLEVVRQCDPNAYPWIPYQLVTRAIKGKLEPYGPHWPVSQAIHRGIEKLEAQDLIQVKRGTPAYGVGRKYFAIRCKLSKDGQHKTLSQ